MLYRQSALPGSNWVFCSDTVMRQDRASRL